MCVADGVYRWAVRVQGELVLWVMLGRRGVVGGQPGLMRGAGEVPGRGVVRRVRSMAEAGWGSCIHRIAVELGGAGEGGVGRWERWRGGLEVGGGTLLLREWRRCGRGKL